MRDLLTLVLLLPLAVVVAPVCLYLVTLTVAAPFGSVRRRAQRPGPVRRFAVLIPAHDEEPVLGRLLASLQGLSYPPNLFDVYVVADNCADATPAIGRARGATVYERRDTENAGKGHALRWLLGELDRAGRVYDAYVVLDADSVVSSNFLWAMNERLTGGARVVQGYYTVLPVRNTRSEALREGALALVHFLRPAAKTAMRASAGLKGNGMCFHRSVIERFGWPSSGLAEDVEFHLTLVAAGIRVVFAPEAVVRAEMPASLGGSDSQNMRWEAGRLATIRRQALPLLWQGLRRRDVAAVDAAVEQLVPPLSVPVALAGVVLVGGAVPGLRPVWVTAAALLGAIIAHVAAGLWLAEAPPRVYRALLYAPIYVAWKALLYARALAGRRDRRWVRTERATDGSRQ
jgi:cellulose synthase/poly-beta-1,6-N-acetylglucosamine synthase-like glycosyltransferase